MTYLRLNYASLLPAMVWAGALLAWPLSAQDGPAQQPGRRYAFDEVEPDVEEFDTDPGLTVTIEDGEVRVAGTTADRNWRGYGILLPIEDKGGALEVSGKFRLAKRRASGLVCLGLETERVGVFFLIFEWHQKKTAYWIQQSYLSIKSKLENGQVALPPNWNEETDFNTLKVRLHPSRMLAECLVNDIPIDIVKFDEAIGRLLSVKLVFQTPVEGREFDIRFDDLAVVAQ